MEEETLDGGGFDGDGEVGKGENKLSQNKNSHLKVCKKPPHNGGENPQKEKKIPLRGWQLKLCSFGYGGENPHQSTHWGREGSGHN